MLEELLKEAERHQVIIEVKNLEAFSVSYLSKTQLFIAKLFNIPVKEKYKYEITFDAIDDRNMKALKIHWGDVVRIGNLDFRIYDRVGTFCYGKNVGDEDNGDISGDDLGEYALVMGRTF